MPQAFADAEAWEGVTDSSINDSSDRPPVHQDFSGKYF